VAAAAALGLLLMLLVVSCGGSSSTGATGSSSSTTEPSTASSESKEASTEEASTEEGSTEEANTEEGKKEEGKKSKTSVATFGSDAAASEEEDAAAILAVSFRARANHDWAGQCATLAKNLAKEYEERASFYKVGKSCAQVLGKEAEGAPAKVLADRFTGSLTAMRVKGNRGYAIFRGTDGKTYSMPMVLEGGSWKVGSVVETPLPE